MRQTIHTHHLKQRSNPIDFIVSSPSPPRALISRLPLKDAKVRLSVEDCCDLTESVHTLRMVKRDPDLQQ